MTHTPAPADDSFQRGERFARLLTASQRRIFAFILSLVPRRSDADDIMQDTSAVLWRKFDQFDGGDSADDFAAWAMGVARLTVLEHLRKTRRAPLPLDGSTLNRLADAAAAFSVDHDRRQDALRVCMSKIEPRDMSLLRERYETETTVQTIASRRGVSSQAVYKSLRRIHELLLHCIRRTVAEEDA